MTPDGFRRLALKLPEAVEVGHMGHPDFRVGGKIFATLGYPDTGSAMVKLVPEQQEAVVQDHPDVFAPVKGGWGRQGATQVRLQAARVATVGPALALAWRNVAPRHLAGRPDARKRKSRPAGRGPTWEQVCALAGGLAGVEQGTSYGTPALRAGPTLLARLKEDGQTIALRVELADRDVLLEADPAAFFLTDHYRGHPYVLVRLSKVAPALLAELLEKAWRETAAGRPKARRRARGGAA